MKNVKKASQNTCLKSILDTVMELSMTILNLYNIYCIVIARNKKTRWLVYFSLKKSSHYCTVAVHDYIFLNN